MNFSLSLLSGGQIDKKEKIQTCDQARERKCRHVTKQERGRESHRQRKRQVCLFQVVCTGHIQHVLCRGRVIELKSRD